MAQQDQRGAGPAHPSLFRIEELLRQPDQPPARYLMPCDPRCVFESEAELEITIMHDPQAEVLAELLGSSIDSVANQVRTHEALMQRADLILTGKGPKRPRTVLELMLHELDRDHLYRGFFYAVMSKSADLVLVAHTFPPRTRVLLKELREWRHKGNQQLQQTL